MFLCTRETEVLGDEGSLRLELQHLELRKVPGEGIFCSLKSVVFNR
jgi:hypothetical protein